MTKNEASLKVIIDDILWMAARYAHGRHTYAPGMIREVVETMQRIYPGWQPSIDKTIEAPEEKPKGMVFETDYLHDIFNPPKK